MSENLNLPVLIYVAKVGCPACQSFEGQWNKIQEYLDGRVRFVKFTQSNNLKLPPCISPLIQWFPTILLAGPKSYFKCFTHDDKRNDMDYDQSYVLKAKKFNSVESPNGDQYAGRPNTAEYVVTWFNQVVNKIPMFDEHMPPRKYAHILK